MMWRSVSTKSWIIVGASSDKRKRRDQVAGGADLMEPHDRLADPVGEREQRAGLRMAPVVRAQFQRRAGAGSPLADGVQLDGHLVAGRSLVQRQQMSAMANDIDTGAVLERSRFAVGADQSRSTGTGFMAPR